MPKIIKDAQVQDDNWVLWRDSETLPDSAPVIVPLNLYLAHREALAKLGEVGVMLASDESPKALPADALTSLPVIAIDFPKFADGRGFSYARELREQHSYQGEIRAVGDIIRDQLFFMSRCGFSSFALPGDELEEALASLNDFSEVYQPDTRQSLPLFRRRSA